MSADDFAVNEVVRFGFRRGRVLRFESRRWGRVAVVQPIGLGQGDGYGTQDVPVSNLRKEAA